MLYTILGQSRSARINDEVVFTVTPTGDRVLTLCDFTAPYDAEVDWGDGATDTIRSNAALSHTYADGTARRVTLRGRLGGFWNATARAAGTKFVTAVEILSSSSLATLADTFRECTALAAIPQQILAPGAASFARAFYNCKSITSALPALWLTHAGAAHGNCFTNCFRSLYGQYGTACPNREYVAAVAEQTYYGRYGLGGCPAVTQGTTSRDYFEAYSPTQWCNYAKYVGNGALYGFTYSIAPIAKCPHAVDNDYASCTSSGVVWGGIVAYQCPTKGGRWREGQKGTIKTQYTTRYSCNQSAASGTGTCGTTCKRVFQAGQSAYYKCKKSGAVCQTSGCPYPHANEASVTAARNAGWA